MAGSFTGSCYSQRERRKTLVAVKKYFTYSGILLCES